MHLPFGAGDIALMLIVTAMAVGMAYVPSPRAKSMLYMLPLPFTAAMLATGQSVDATHMCGMTAIWLYPWVAWLMHGRLGLHIILASGAALGIHTSLSLALARIIPSSGASEQACFWSVWVVALAAGGLALLVPARREASHRSALPAYLKVPLVLLLVAGVVMLKEQLRGFMPTFPFATVFAVYESRRSLHTLASRFPIFLVGFLPMIVACRWAIPAWGHAAGLAAGWAVYLPVYIGLDRLRERRRGVTAP